MNDQLTEHFRRSEFACQCGCGFAAIDQALVAGLERLRMSFGRPIAVLSGCRCSTHNAAEHGARDSQHVGGLAADIRIEGVGPRVIYAEAVRVPQFRGFGVDDERGFIHLDTRLVTARWCYHNGQPVAWHDSQGKPE